MGIQHPSNSSTCQVCLLLLFAMRLDTFQRGNVDPQAMTSQEAHNFYRPCSPGPRLARIPLPGVAVEAEIPGRSRVCIQRKIVLKRSLCRLRSFLLSCTIRTCPLQAVEGNIGKHSDAHFLTQVTACVFHS
ncbi:hypothetical protein EJ08DRAFT_99244 [Tothia fuscella]|uniref:Secreted protein n=1 Tax=Tothia fuscella TaxID=1048955 RepID=A0A9P4NE38_9PEZI|nr:hypothetical protein EJ08DRAFT_99244 [Tothia fuscella]